MHEVPCNLCGSSKYTFFHKLGESQIVKCSNCGLYFLNPQLDKEDLQQLYDHTYFLSEESAITGYEDYISDKENIVRTSHKKLKRIEKYYPQKGTILDIGCATGFFLLAAREREWDARGVEYSDYASQIAREQHSLQVKTGTIKEAEYKDEFFDCVTMWDLIEHVTDPMADLAEVNRIMKPDGILAIITPNVASFIAKLWGKKWLLWNRTDHLYFFSPNTLNQMLKKNGFKIIKVKNLGYGGKFVSVDFIFERLKKYHQNTFSFFQKFMQGIGLAKLVFYADWGDNFVVFAYKE